ncbi:JAB domain-containing protein [Sporosarcina sp. FSL K6-1508]|uniref:JAB domain-containing protein n=1 Tax=Sporosarcina sp. FSL K6-1508 TaxID=2921553 RepID=UPI0030FD0BF4
MYKPQAQQLELLMVKEEEKRLPAKRVDIVSLRLVKETSLLYKDRAIRSPEDGYNLFKQYLGELDREYLVVMCLDVKNQPTAINVCHIGSLNASIVYGALPHYLVFLFNCMNCMSLFDKRVSNLEAGISITG